MINRLPTFPSRLDPLRLTRDVVADVVANVGAWERIPARPGRYAPLPTPTRAIISAP